MNMRVANRRTAVERLLLKSSTTMRYFVLERRIMLSQCPASFTLSAGPVVCTSTWSLAPFIQYFHNNCTMDDLKNPTEIQLFILQDKLQLLGMEQFCWILFIVKILGYRLLPNTFTMLQ